MLATFMVSCNEELEYDVTVQGVPAITSFSPSSGVVGTQIVIEGENLQNVTTAYINDIEVEVSSRITGSYITITATSDGRSGIIKVVSAEGDASTSSSFTYTYPTPTLEVMPSTFVAGEQVFIEGSNLNAIQEIWITSEDGTVTTVDTFTAIEAELEFKVPNVSAGEADLEFSYFNGSTSASFVAGSVIIVNDGVFITSDLDGTYAMGDQITIEGSGLAVIEKVFIGDIEQSIVGTTTATQLVFQIVDDPIFVDGLNVADLTFATSDGSVQYTKEDFNITMPVYYSWSSCTITSRSGDSNFFNFENGRAYSISQIETLDPVTAALSYQAHTASNVLSDAVSDADYYSINPYIYMNSLGSAAYLYGPASNSVRMGGLGSPIASSAYGTPSVILFALLETIEAENTIIQKVKNGTFTEDDFDPSVFSSFDIGSRNSNGELSGLLYAPGSPGSTTAYNEDPGTVVLVMYMKPNRTDWVFSMDNVVKFGLMDMTNLTYVAGSAYEASAGFNAFWQRTSHNQ